MIQFPYGSKRWRIAAKKCKASNNWLCQPCMDIHNIEELAVFADHFIEVADSYNSPINERNRIWWSADNHVPMCPTCHNKKTQAIITQRKVNAKLAKSSSPYIVVSGGIKPVNLLDKIEVKTLVYKALAL